MEYKITMSNSITDPAERKSRLLQVYELLINLANEKPKSTPTKTEESSEQK